MCYVMVLLFFCTLLCGAYYVCSSAIFTRIANRDGGVKPLDLISSTFVDYSQSGGDHFEKPKNNLVLWSANVLL